MEAKGLVIPGANPDLMDSLNTLAGSLLGVIGAFENESNRIKGLPLLPLVEISIQDELDRIVQIPSSAVVHAQSFLDEQVWKYYIMIGTFYDGVDKTFDELNQLLSENPASFDLVSIPFTELQSVPLKIKKAKEIYESVYIQISKYRADKRI